MFDYEKFFADFEFTPNEQTKAMLREAGESFAAAALSAAAMSLFTEIIKNGLLAPKVTRIEVDNSVPAQLFAVSGKKGPDAVFISTRKYRVNPVPAIVLALSALAVHLAVTGENKEKDTINV